MKILWYSMLICITMSSISSAKNLTTESIDLMSERALARIHACGPISLWCAAKYLDKNLDCEQLLKETTISKDGVTLQKILDLGQKYDIDGTAIKTSVDHLEQLPIGSIIVTNLGKHCVVYAGSKAGHAAYFEPGSQEFVYTSITKLKLDWTGEAIIYSPMLMDWYSFCVALCSVCIILCGVFLCFDSYNSKKGE